MNSYMTNLNNCRIIIKDAFKDIVVADTIITSYDRKSNTVWVNALSLKLCKCVDVTVLIFGEDFLYEYVGKVNKTNIANEIEIRLYKGKEREDRVCRRYQFSKEGSIEKIKIQNQEIPLRKPIEIKTLNISASGILLQSISESFHIQDEIALAVIMDSKRFRMDCRIVRAQNNTILTEEYGCQILGMSPR